MNNRALKKILFADRGSTTSEYAVLVALFAIPMMVVIAPTMEADGPLSQPFWRVWHAIYTANGGGTDGLEGDAAVDMKGPMGPLPVANSNHTSQPDHQSDGNTSVGGTNIK